MDTRPRYFLTACARDNTTTLFTSAAYDQAEVETLVASVKRSRPDLVITIQDSWTGIVDTRR